ncbi:MAG: phosphoribosyltransferase [Candidatus Bathyarchaeota archaeon]|nr:phosphoribosyltransferase [Candidatus Termiticorpusculum sp.]MCL2868989.1 phosphoribosyltransferase [Candidatus Termiticorpusculum sp.]
MANTTTQYEIPTWNQIHKMLLNQAKKIQKNNYQPDIIIGIAQGGTIPTRILTDLLQQKNPQTTTNTPIITSIEIKFYKNIAQTNNKPTLKQPLTIPINDKKILIVDDISDTGQTLKLAKQHLTEKGAIETKTATLYTKTTTQTPPDYAEKTTNKWIVFPWEINETIQNILQKHKKDNQTTNNEFTQLVKAGIPKQLLKQTLKTIQEQQH